MTEQAAVAAPANDACADAIVISSLPYDGSGYDTTQSADTNRAVWYQYTSDSDHYVYFGTLTSNYETQITVYTGSCGSLSTVVTWFKEQFPQESQSVYWWWAETGVTYWIKVESSAIYHNTAPQSGGWLAFQLWEYDATLQSGDLFVDCQNLVRCREGVGFVDFTSDLYGQTPTGNAIDYTARELQDLYANPHTNTRLYVCCFGTSPLVEVVDAQDLSYEVAFIDTAALMAGVVSVA